MNTIKFRTNYQGDWTDIPENAEVQFQSDNKIYRVRFGTRAVEVLHISAESGLTITPSAGNVIDIRQSDYGD